MLSAAQKQKLKTYIPLIATVRRRWDRLRRARRISEFLSTHRPSKLHIGCGSHCLDGWCNTDLEPAHGRVIALDATRPFPFPDGSFDYVFSEHFIEHIDYAQALFCLRECHRVSRTGAKIRIVTPNARNIIRLISEPDTPLHQTYCRWAAGEHLPTGTPPLPASVVNNFYRAWGHRFIHDPDTLAALLGQAGFHGITRCAPGESTDQHLRGIEGHGEVIGDEFNRFESMVMEATK